MAPRSAPGDTRSTARVTVLLFAGAADAAGCRSLAEELPPGATLRDLAARLGARFPRLAAYLPIVLWAVNEEYAPAGRVLVHGDRVAIIPPVSGGADAPEGAATQPSGKAVGAVCRVVAEPISLDDALRSVLHPGAGAAVLFLGAVRAVTGDRLTAAIEYEAYASMAEKELQKVAREAAERWPDVRLCLVHRVGRLAVGEASVVVAASAPHRGDAFAACRHAIDRIKETVPVWKREISPDGDGEWVRWQECDHGETERE